MSRSAAGKSSLLEAAAQFVPEEERHQYTALTPQALFHMPEGELANKALFVNRHSGHISKFDSWPERDGFLDCRGLTPSALHDDWSRKVRLSVVRRENSVPSVSEIIFEVHEDEVDGGFTASAVGGGIHTEADSLEELRRNVREAVDCYFDDRAQAPKIIRLHFVRDEVLAR